MRPIDGDALKITLDTFATQFIFDGLYARGLVMECIDAAPTVATDINVLNKWISVKDRLPEPPAQCLVYSNKSYRPRGMETATYTNLGWMTAAYFPEITHWMPLPEPPEEVTGDA